MSVIDKALTSYFKRYPIPHGSTIGVAVSGGADSLCLAIRLGEYARQHGYHLCAATVDHHLRSQSSEEAKQVHQYLKAQGIPHTVLSWNGPKPKTRVEEKARQKRYELLSEWCHENHIRFLFLAHHQGDQAETFWSRLARGSGLDGLAAIAEQTRRDDIILCRPFLHLSKDVLESDLKKRHVSWVQDEMNQDDAYERVRWRHRQPTLSEMELTPVVIDRATRRLSRVRQAMDYYVDRFMNALVDIHPQGYACITEQSLKAVPDEIALRVVMKVIGIVHPQVANLSLDSVEKWWEKNPRQATLGGCILVRQKGLLFIAREPARMDKETQIPADYLTRWDRFIVLSDTPITITRGVKEASLPPQIQKSIPRIIGVDSDRVRFFKKGEKGLENFPALDYNKRKSESVYILFEGEA